MIQIDIEKLYMELDRRRRHDGLTWAVIAKEIGSSPAAVSRLGRGTAPTAVVLVNALAWLGYTSFDGFVRDEERTPS